MRPAPVLSRFQSHNLFGRAIFNRDPSLLRFPLQPHGAPSRLWSGMARGELPWPGRLLEGAARLQPALLRSPQPGSPRARLVLQITPKGLERPCPAPHGLCRMGRWADHLQHPQEPAGSGHGTTGRSQARLSPARPRHPLCASPRGELRQGKTVFLKHKRKAGHFCEEGAHNYIFFHRLK